MFLNWGVDRTDLNWRPLARKQKKHGVMNDKSPCPKSRSRASLTPVISHRLLQSINYASNQMVRPSNSDGLNWPLKCPNTGSWPKWANKNSTGTGNKILCWAWFCSLVLGILEVAAGSLNWSKICSQCFLPFSRCKTPVDASMSRTWSQNLDPDLLNGDTRVSGQAWQLYVLLLGLPLEIRYGMSRGQVLALCSVKLLMGTWLVAQTVSTTAVRIPSLWTAKLVKVSQQWENARRKKISGWCCWRTA